MIEVLGIVVELLVGVAFLVAALVHILWGFPRRGWRERMGGYDETGESEWRHVRYEHGRSVERHYVQVRYRRTGRVEWLADANEGDSFMAGCFVPLERYAPSKTAA